MDHGLDGGFHVVEPSAQRCVGRSEDGRVGDAIKALHGGMAWCRNGIVPSQDPDKRGG